jgi:hypothetical protein
MLLTTVIQPTVDQVDQFGEASSRRTMADKVRNAVYPLFKLSYEQSSISLFQGNRWIVKATQTKRSGIDLHKLIETLAELGVKEPATLVESCREETVYPTFRAQPIPTL